MHVSPNEIGVYSSSVFGQVNEEAFGGLFKARLRGERTTSKQVPLALNSMPQISLMHMFLEILVILRQQQELAPVFCIQ